MNKLRKRMVRTFTAWLLCSSLILSMYHPLFLAAGTNTAYAEGVNHNLINDFDPDIFAVWGYWAGDGSTVAGELEAGYSGQGLKITYNKSADGWGLVAHADLPSEWDLSGTNFIVFQLKGDGIPKSLWIELEEADGGDRYRKLIPVAGGGWNRVIIPITELEHAGGGGSADDALDLDRVAAVNISPEELGAGSFTLDNFSFIKDETVPEDERPYFPPHILFNFSLDDSSNWERILDDGAGAVFDISAIADGASGPAIRFNYELQGWGAFTARSTGTYADWSPYEGISFWARGEAGQQFYVRLEEGPAPNEIWRIAIELETDEWEHIYIPFDSEFIDENDDGNGEVDLFNIYKLGFAPITPGNAVLDIDEIVLMTDGGGLVIDSAKAAASGSIFTDNPIQITAGLYNFSDQPEQRLIGYTIKDIAGHTILEDEVLPDEVAPGGSAEAAITFELEKHGYYEVETYIVVGDSRESVRTTSIAYVMPADGERKRGRALAGYSTHYDYLPTDALREQEADLIALSGAALVRNDFLWDIIEPAKGEFDWTLYDHVVETNAERGIEMIGLLAYSSMWGNTGPAGAELRQHYPPERLMDYADYVYETVSRYKDTIQLWELWNEPNLDGFFRPTADARAYVQLMKAGYLAAKRADPDATVAMAGLSGTGIAYLTEMLEYGAADYMDALVIHPYQPGDPDEGQSFVNDIASVRAKLPHKPIWLTEWGWRSDEQGLANQALYTIKGYMLSHAMGVDNNVVYSFNIATDEHFGFANPAVGGEVKPIYAAAAAMFHIMNGYNYIGDLGLGAGVTAIAFEEHQIEEETNVVVLWSKTEQVVRIETNEEVMLYDLYGNAAVLTSADGYVDLTVGHDPQYVVGKLGAFVENAEPRFVQPEGPGSEPNPSWLTQSPYYARDHLAITRGYLGEVNVEIFNYRNEPIEGTLELAGLPSDWFGHDEDRIVDYEVPAYGTRTIAFRIEPPLSAELGLYAATVMDLDEHMASTIISIRVTPAIGVSIGKNALILRNHIDEAVSGEIRFNHPDGWTIVSGHTSFSLLPGQSGTYAYTLTPGESAAIIGGKLEISGALITASEEIPFADELLQAAGVRTAQSISVDGVKDDEWRHAAPTLLNQASQASAELRPFWTASDLSAELYAQWDEEYLYLFATVTDNIHNQQQSGGGMWQGDSIQIAFDAANSGASGYGPGVYELQIGNPNSADAQIFKGMGFAASGLMAEAEIVVLRDENAKTTSYEMAIPFAELEGITDIQYGKAIGYSILINDNDGTGRKGYMEWSSGIGAAKNAALFGTLWLLYDKRFEDVAATHWAQQSIKRLAALHVVNGVSTEKFAPDRAVTRAEMVALIARALGLQASGKSAFADVSEAAWYSDAVTAAVEAGIVNGRSAERFAPNELLTREEMAALVVRAHAFRTGSQLEAAEPAGYADQNQISRWAAEYVDAAAALGLMQGKDHNQFAPAATATRAEGAAVVASLMQ